MNLKQFKQNVDKMNYNELINIQFDYDYLRVIDSDDEIRYAYNQLFDKIITPSQFKVIVDGVYHRQ